jgi:hypothetical protein
LRAFGLLLRFYSYLFHLGVSFFFLALGIVSATSATPIHLDAFGLPPDKALLRVFALGIVGLFSTVLAFTGTFRLLFPLWAAFIAWLMVKGFFLSSFAFDGPAEFRSAILITLGAVVAFFGALWVLKPRSRL